MHDFVLALIGGIMIGAAAVLLMAAHGKIMGISGIVSGLIPDTNNFAITSDWQWRILFIAGVLAAPIISFVATGRLPTVSITHSPAVLIIAGLLVGIGTGLGNGCTSGHGVCGMSRFSVRSITATMLFIASAAVTVYVVRHL